MTQFYSSKSNAKRATRKELGPDAIEGVDFKIVEESRGKWHCVSSAVGKDRAVAQAAPATTPTRRTDSKQAMVLDMLRRPEGATNAQIREATGWQPHTVRGAIAGTFKKKLGYNITSEKPADGDRVYRIVYRIA